ncbi:MAG: OmpH family outer membrane protein [Bacteroidia bacterium]|nr:OmpH family outer membrane protein [Bacteroidia bacterium]MBP8074042.1 OmpH family outer membrane protein [Bacteroidia bacterium]
MKKYILFFLLGLVAMAGNSQTVTKIGYTNVELILQYMPETKAIETELSKLEKAISSALEVKQKYYQQKLIEFMEYKQSGKPLSPENEKLATTELQRLEAEIQKGVAEAESRLMKRRMDLLKPVQDKMQGAIDAVAKEGGYTYILNQAVGAGIPSILYGKESDNVTAAIAKKLGIAVE